MSEDDGMEEVEIDLNHPWVVASTIMKPQPVPSSVQLVPLEFGDGRRGAMISVIDPTGVKNCFLPPEVLQALLMNGQQIMQQWAIQDSQKLTIADKNIERSVIEEQKIHEAARNGKGPNPFRSV